MSKQLKRPINLKPYDNCEMLSPAGEFMAFVSKKSMKWYVKRDLAIKIDEKTFQLTFEPKGNGNQGDVDYQRIPRKNKCVVCGEKENLTRHHVVPYCYRKFLPVEYKTRNSFDLIAICHECHDEYERKALLQKKLLGEKYLGKACCSTPVEAKSLTRLRSNLGALIRHSSKMPEDRVQFLLRACSAYFNEEVTLENSESFFERVDKLLTELWEQRQALSEQVLEAFLKEGNELIDFIHFWREHFLKHAKPKHLSKLWLEDYKKRKW